MDNMQLKIEMWTKLIQSEQLQNVLEDIQMSIRVRPDNKLNDNIFRLLIHLYRTAEKCDKQNYETGKKIAELTKLLCSLLIKVPHDNNFVKALFKIVRYLITLNLYEDAADICCYLEPGHLYNPQNETMELVTKVLALWHILVNDMYFAFTNEALNTENYNNLKNIIKYEMKMIQIAYKNYTRHIIVRINTHLDRMSRIDEETNKYFDDFCKYIMEYLAKAQLYIDKDEKYLIYSHILGIIRHIIYRSINITDIACVVKTLNKLSGYFKYLLKEDEECYEYFQQFQSLCITLLLPIENFTNDSAKSMQNVICCYLNIAQKYGYTEGVKWNILTSLEITEPIFMYWQKCIETDKHIFNHLLDTGLMIEIMNLLVHFNVEEFYHKQKLIKCTYCLDKICTVKRDLFNMIITKCKCISLLCIHPIKTLPEEVCVLARKILEQIAKSIIHEIRESKCKRWTHLWTHTCYTLIYNLGISQHYKESICLFSLLCTSIFQLQEIKSYSKYNENSQIPKDIVGFTLHKLSLLHYNNGVYREAMTVSALNALLNYNEPTTKAFRMWINIKKCVSGEIAKLTILECLRKDKDKIKNEMGLSFDISKYDLVELCSHEIRSLLEKNIAFTDSVLAVLEEFKKLEPSNHQYAHMIQLLGYYLLGFQYDKSVLKYHEQTISDLKQDKLNSVVILCLEANLNFFIFVEELHMMNEQIEKEMKNTEFALCAPKLPELTETRSPNIIPAYTMINVKKDSSLMLSLQKCLKTWKQLIKCNINEIVKAWEPNLILCMLITAGEYSRLYRYEDCETEAWKLAYKLASEINDHRAIIYITGRCISLRQIDYDWIATAKKHAIKHKDSKDDNVIGAIAIFWISLADLYFECGKCDDAKQLLKEARNLPGISFLANTSVYLLSLDVIIRNSNLYKDDMQHEDYDSYIVESIYAMRNLNQGLLTKIWKSRAEYLFSYDVLFTTTVNLSMRLNSLLSFREISADLVQRLQSAQSLGAVLRIAELLKSLCYIDLSRSQLDDCEVKLEGLEHMLDIETFQLSINSKSVQTPAHPAVTPTKILDPIRDVSHHDASPVLRKKVFDLPEFILHANCDCYRCNNVSYQYLVFASTYIRAQLYVLQSHVVVALDHFYGAFEIRQRLFEEEKSVLPENWPRDEIGVKQFSWQARFYITDYIYLLIDFCYFLKTTVMSTQQDVFDIVNLAINICRKYKLEGHPIYSSVKELAFDNCLQPILESSEYLGFTIPQPHEIDVSNYAKVLTNPSICATPCAQNYRTKKPLSVRRKKNPVALKITKVNLIWSDDEDDDNLLKPLATNSNKKSKSQYLARRKILEEDLSDNASSSTDSMPEKTKLEIHQNGDRNSTQRKSIKDIMTEVVPLVPNISQNLMNLVDGSDVPATMENIDKLVKKVESLKIESTTRRKSVRNIKQLTVADYNENVNQAIELLKNMAINEKTNENIDSLTLTKTENDNLQEVDQKTSEKPPFERKFFKSGGLVTKGNASTRCSKYTRTKSLVDNETTDIRTTRFSLRMSQKKKPS